MAVAISISLQLKYLEIESLGAEAAKEAAIGAALNRSELAQLNTLLRKVLSGLD